MTIPKSDIASVHLELTLNFIQNIQKFSMEDYKFMLNALPSELLGTVYKITEIFMPSFLLMVGIVFIPYLIHWIVFLQKPLLSYCLLSPLILSSNICTHLSVKIFFLMSSNSVRMTLSWRMHWIYYSSTMNIWLEDMKITLISYKSKDSSSCSYDLGISSTPPFWRTSVRISP